VALLARREHTRAELVRKLTPFGTKDEIDAVIANLQSANLQSDARFAEAYLRSQARRLGPARLRQSLKQKGVDADTVTEQMETADLPDELQQAREIWTRKFGTAPGDAKEWGKQARFLQARGFSSSVIRRLLKAPNANGGEE
jgi:regulatory protein